ncbi:MAG TPA: ABC transporter permease subunit [Vicinamibacteria bacterium]|nr:ABC transporter permease subunit [Vicinamibacteria bacterium]
MSAMAPRLTPDSPPPSAPVADARDVSRPVPFLRAAKAVFDLSLEGMVWSRRSLLMVALLFGPALLAVAVRIALTRLPPRVGAFDLYGLMIAFVYVRNALPLAALFYGTALISDEVEGKTITYLLARPIQRVSVLAGKFASYLVTTLAMALPAVVITFFVLNTIRGWSGIGTLVPELFRDMGVIILTLVVYGAFFTLMGVVLRRPVIPGLLFLFVWELLANAPGYLPRFTITAYLRSLIHHRPPDEGLAEIFAQVLPTALCLEAVGAMIVVFLAGAAWIFSQREYVLDQ